MTSRPQSDQQPSTSTRGWRWLLVGGVMALAGAALMIFAGGGGGAEGVGVALALFAVLPTALGAVMLALAYSGRSDAGGVPDPLGDGPVAEDDEQGANAASPRLGAPHGAAGANRRQGGRP